MPRTKRATKEPPTDRRKGARKLLVHRGLLPILAAGLGVRLWNIGWGLPHLYEEAIPLRFGMNLWPSLPPSVDFHFFVYPALSYYLHLFVQFLHFCAGFALGGYASLAEFISGFEGDPTAYATVARLATVVIDGGTIVACYMFADRRFGRHAALIAAAFVALNHLHVGQAHLVNVDTLLAFFSVLLLPSLHALMETPSARSYALSGAIVGLAAASKYNGAILAAPVVFAHLLSPGGPGRGLRPDRLLLLAIAGSVSIAVFLLFNPLILSHGAAFLEKFSDTETHMEAGHLGINPGMSTPAFYLLESLPSILGIPILLVAAGSMAWMLAGRQRQCLPLLAIPISYFVMLFGWQMRADRYVFPAVPFLLMIAAIGLSAFLARRVLPALARRAASGERGHSIATAVPVVACLLLLVPQVREISADLRELGLEDTRSAAMGWIQENIPPGSAIAAGPFGIELPPRKYINLTIQFSAVNSERMTPFYNPGWYENIDLVVVSDFDYERYRREPERFRTILGYLDTLTSRWELVRAFEPGNDLSGPSIRLYRFAGEDSDDPFPASLIGELLDSRLEDKRKVSFLGKLALTLSVQGKVTRSEQLLRALLRLEPGNETAMKSLRDIERFRASVARMESPGDTRVAEGASIEAAALVARADEAFSAGDLVSAERTYREAIGRDSSQVNAYLGLTMVYAAKDDKASVVRTLKVLLTILPPDSEEYRKVLWQLQSIEANP